MHDPGKTEKGHAADNVPEADRSKEAPPAYKPEQISAGLHLCALLKNRRCLKKTETEYETVWLRRRFCRATAPLRTAWDEGKEGWYFSVVDVAAVLTDGLKHHCALPAR